MSDELEEIIAEFITEAEESLDRIDPLFVEIETNGNDKNILNEIFRCMHTIKGAAGFLGFQSIVDVSHSAENILKKLREGEILLNKPLTDVILKSVDTLRLLLRHLKLKDGKEENTKALLEELETELDKTISAPPGHETGIVDEQTRENSARDHSFIAPREEENLPERKECHQTLRVETDKIDNVMDLTGEVVLIRNRLLNIVNYLELTYSDDPYVESLFETVSFLDLVTSDMQVAVMKMRMQPIKKIFSKFPRLVRDMTNALGKDVNLIISGEHTEVDKSVIERIGDPLVHIIRNAIDHGIEQIDERLLKGKPERGTIEINAYQKGSQIVIEVSDDGRGIDLEGVKRKAIKKALLNDDEAERMSDNEVINLIFLPGFSTVDVATELSGRGVGMDVVKTNISKLNGYIEVITKKDAGTALKISIPLTLAIIHVLMVRTGSAHYAIPLSSIEETLKVSKRDFSEVVGQKVLNIRERVLPVFELSDILGNGRDDASDERYVVVISMGETKFCIALDGLLGQEEIVIKAIEGIRMNSTFILGATITGEGKVVLILDPAGISRHKFGLIQQ